LGRLHDTIGCHRLDWLHKLTTELARTSGFVAVEDLHVTGLIRNRCLSRSFSDAAVGKLLDVLESKVRIREACCSKWIDFSRRVSCVTAVERAKTILS